MQLYCRIDENGIWPPAALPSEYDGITDFDQLTPEELARFNWFPFISSEAPDYNPSTHKLVENLRREGNQVIQSFIVENLKFYCRISDGLIHQPAFLPTSYANISNFHMVSEEIAAMHGFYPCVIADYPKFQESKQRAVETLEFVNGSVIQSWQVLDLTPEESIAFATSRLTEIGNRIGPFIDQQVAVRKYDDMKSAATWSLSNVSAWRNEGQEALSYRDVVWQQFQTLVIEVEQGIKEVPTVEDWFAALPMLWAENV